MIKCTEYLYKRIGARIRNKRKERHLTQVYFYPAIDTSILSKIENGKAITGKNPYLLNSCQIDSLCHFFKCDAYQLIWGTKEEQENFAKILLLSIMCNGEPTGDREHHQSINPFCYFESTYDLFMWAFEQNGIPAKLKDSIRYAIDQLDAQKKDSEIKIPYDSSKISVDELRNKIDLHFSESYGFFYNKENFDIYTTLDVHYDSAIEKISDSIFHLLLTDYAFTERFADYAPRAILNQDTVKSFMSTKNRTNENEIHNEKFFNSRIEEFLIHPSHFIGIAIDKKILNYCYFVGAFNNLWEKHKETFMNYFNKKIFSNSDIIENGLKKFKNTDFYAILTSDELFQLCNNTKTLEEYMSSESILAKNFFRISVQEAVSRHEIYNQYEKVYRKLNNNTTDLWEYLSNSKNATKNCAQLVLQEK